MHMVTEHNVPGLNSLMQRKGTIQLEIFMLQCFHFVFSYVPFHTYLLEETILTTSSMG